jgi:hypothetical protein
VLYTLNVVVVVVVVVGGGGGGGGGAASAGIVKSTRRLWTEQVLDMGKQEMHTKFL